MYKDGVSLDWNFCQNVSLSAGWHGRLKQSFTLSAERPLLSSFSLCSVLSSSTCHPVITSSSPSSPPPILPLSAGSAGDREATAHHNSMNDLTERERERLTLTPQKMKEERERWLGREGGNRWQKRRGGIGRESIITSELKGRERESELSFSGVQVAACYSAE